ncbi:MAG: acetyl-CoA carboxylase biotin carboxyl carrier protein subunit [Thermoflavifilum sp.]|nr:acetyl-CoA carboxylase biotin carboxyl carrier protein subunit [Thermoflavifilum sp.]MCL6513255.1 acetyl-CoA carboxylase biotin carboxyl carrier protein subunit [Alicyclobacillus sp.]
MALVTASMAGTVLQVLVAPGQTVEVGQDVVVLESMKMEVPVQADTSGVVVAVRVQPGDFVNEGDPLLDLE